MGDLAIGKFGDPAVCLALMALWAALPVLGEAVDAEKPYDVVLLRPSRFIAERRSRAEAAHGFLRTARTIVEAAGLTHHTLGDEEVLASGVPQNEFLLCAYSPAMQSDVAAEVFKYLDAGGHALFCYYLDEPLRGRFGVSEPVYTPAGDEQRFACVRPTEHAPPGMPGNVVQNSWNAFVLADLGPKAHAAATWVSAQGTTTTAAALVMTSEAAWFGHVFTEGDTDAKAQFLLSIIGAYDASVWARALPRALDALCRFHFASSPQELVTFATRNGPSLAARLAADEIIRLQQQARQGEPWRAFDQLTRVRQRTKNAYLRSFPSRHDAMRAAWVVSPWGIRGWGWERTARAARQASLDALFVRIEWTGRARYRSEVLPVALEEGEDPLRDALDACHRHGLEVHAWFINHNWRTPPKEIIERFAAEGRWQIGPDGANQVKEGGDRVYWLNPAHPDNVKLQADMMSEVAGGYEVDGVHFDYIRYENYSGSYGELDRRLFEAYAKTHVADWPIDVLPQGKLHEAFCDWRCEQVSNVVRACSNAVRDANPKCKLSAAVYPSWPYHRKSVGQDWARWLKEGWLDFLCPMTYDAPNYYDRHLDRVKRQREAAGDKPLFVGLGAWLHPNAVNLAEQIYEDRQSGADGFLLFSLDERLITEILPDLQSGVFAQP